MRKVMFILSIFFVIVLALLVYAMFPSLFFASKGYSSREIKDMVVVAHRGGASIGMENSLSCIEKGIRAGADMIEIDLHLTADGVVVVCHDQSIDRTTDGEGLIRELTLEQIRTHHLVDAEGNATSETIPTLEEVLDLVGDRCRLLIEIKRTQDIYQGIEQKMLDILEAHNMIDRVVVQSFNDSVLANIHAIRTDVRLEKLLFCKLPLIPVIFDGTFSRFDYEKYNYIESFNFFYGGVDDSMINTMHSHGKEVKIWTLESPDDAVHLAVDAVITNRPDLWQ